jgi:co-chaperonin GroES (HSP10)
VLRPLRDLIRITRVDGHGIERMSKGGIVIPATCEGSVKTKGDYFQARIEALGPDAEKAFAGELKPGDEVLVYTYSGTAESVFTGLPGGEKHTLFVKPEDILAAVVPDLPAAWMANQELSAVELLASTKGNGS